MEDIVAAVGSENGRQLELEENADEGEEDIEVCRDTVSFKVVEESLSTIKLYAIQHEIDAEEIFKPLNFLEDFFTKRRLNGLRQPQIDEFFSPSVRE